MLLRNRRTLLASIVVASAIAACAAPSEEDVAQSSAALVPACGTNLAQVDGVWAKSNGAYMNTGTPCVPGTTPVGALAYQCVEYAQRYMNTIFGIKPLWPVQYAQQMCSSYPAGVTPHEPRSGYVPKHGDLVVWNRSWGGGYGHVAVIDKVNGSTMEVVEQNASIGGSMGVRNTPVDASDIECYVTANANTGGGGGGAPGGGGTSSGSCALGDGLYCGTNGAGTDPSKLYRCRGGAVTVEQTCSMGCEWRPNPENDRCRTSATCPYGDGMYCGGNGISGDSSVLFECGGGKIVASKRCANGCERRPVRENDRCL